MCDLACWRCRRRKAKSCAVPGRAQPVPGSAQAAASSAARHSLAERQKTACFRVAKWQLATREATERGDAVVCRWRRRGSTETTNSVVAKHHVSDLCRGGRASPAPPSGKPWYGPPSLQIQFCRVPGTVPLTLASTTRLDCSYGCHDSHVIVSSLEA